MISKYKAEKVIYDGIVFDSKMERDFYINLKEAGVKFERQPLFLLQEKFAKGDKKYQDITYKADFRVGNTVYDVKGKETADFKLKKKMFLYKYKELDLICVRPCPKKYIKEFGIYGFIDIEVHKKLKKKNKK